MTQNLWSGTRNFRKIRSVKIRAGRIGTLLCAFLGAGLFVLASQSNALADAGFELALVDPKTDRRLGQELLPNRSMRIKATAPGPGWLLLLHMSDDRTIKPILPNRFSGAIYSSNGSPVSYPTDSQQTFDLQAVGHAEWGWIAGIWIHDNRDGAGRNFIEVVNKWASKLPLDENNYNQSQRNMLDVLRRPQSGNVEADVAYTPYVVRQP